ncbi:subtilisin-like protease SBT2.5 isoform X2 [Typha angustifolia]
MVLIEDDPIINYKSSQNHMMSGDKAQKYKEKVLTRHDIFLESLLPTGSYTKLYSYAHLLNGFALHTTSEKAIKILDGARGVRVIHEDIKMTKMTTYTPEYTGISSGVWPVLGGAERSGDGVVIGMIDTGINPSHPSFSNDRPTSVSELKKFKGTCEAGDAFPSTACNGKIVSAQFFARGAIAAGDFNATHEYASPFDADGHGSHTASIAAGNYHVPVSSKCYNYGYASGMAPGARIAIYRASYSFGGYMSDVVAAIDKAVEDGVDILSLSIGPSSVPPGPASFLNILEVQLLFATKAGVSVVQAVGNRGPDSSTVLSFSPWITSVAASTTDRKYNNSIILGNGQVLSGIGLSPPTPDEVMFPIAAAEDVSTRNRNGTTAWLSNCQDPGSFIPSVVRGKLIICAYVTRFIYAPTRISVIFDTIQKIGAAGVIVTTDRDLLNSEIGVESMTLSVPGIVLQSTQDSQALWDYYSSNTARGVNGHVISFVGTGRIQDGRHAIYTGDAPTVASYSSRGPDINNNLREAADVLKPNIMAPGSAIWGAWSPSSHSIEEVTGEDFVMLSGTSMATPHISGIVALIKQKHPDWSPAAIMSAMMTTADVTDRYGRRILAQQSDKLSTATPFDYGAGFINGARAIDPGLIFDIGFENYIQFLCTVPGIDEGTLKRAVGVGCPMSRMLWSSDLNTASVTVTNLVGSRRVARRVTSVATVMERYTVTVQEPAGVAVTVTPQVFMISPNSSRGLRILLQAIEATSTFTFGEVVLNGDKNHVVRIPLAVLASSTLSP